MATAYEVFEITTRWLGHDAAHSRHGAHPATSTSPPTLALFSHCLLHRDSHEEDRMVNEEPSDAPWAFVRASYRVTRSEEGLAALELCMRSGLPSGCALISAPLRCCCRPRQSAASPWTLFLMAFTLDLTVGATLAHGEDNVDSFVLLGHPRHCPALLTRSREPDYTNQKIRVAVSVLVIHNGHVLLERRPQHMRTFPLCWVFPGGFIAITTQMSVITSLGHIDRGETPEAAAARELFEETGLKARNFRPFAMWESCYPTFLDEGPVRRQHLVIYFLAELDEPFASHFPCFPLDETVTPGPSMVLDANELDMAAWVPLSSLTPSLLFGNNAAGEFTTLVCHSDSHRQEKRSFERLKWRTKRELVEDGDREGLSLGAAFALFALRETQSRPTAGQCTPDSESKKNEIS